MNRKTWYFLHKWIGIVVGVFFLTWTISGIVMMLPAGWFAPSDLGGAKQTDYRAALLSPAEAVIELENALEESIGIAWMGLGRVGETDVYELHLIDGRVYLLDASTADIVELTPELAEKIVRDRITSDDEQIVQAETVIVERLESHDLLYPFGKLPVYRVQFKGDHSNLFYVSVSNGSVSQSNSITRLRAVIASMHTFEPIRLFTNNSTIRMGLLISISIIGIAAALTGYYLALLPYLSRRTKSKKTRTASAPLDGTGSS